ncbi:MAG: DNA repair protein RecO [Candidatus Omnitrophota bacterium]|nr:DNA repair protein RecO [Candidatus Omnitrophota bacterium]
MIEKDIGFVIKRRNFRETSVIVDIFTLRFGRITGILKGFYTIKKEFSSFLDILTLNEFVFYPKQRQIWLVSYVDYICGYSFLRKDIPKARVAAVFSDLIDKTMQPWDINQDIFYLLKDCLEWLDKEKDYKVIYVFLIKFLTISGFKPEFNRCIICHKELEREISFSISRGGLVCSFCCRSAPDSKRIRNETSSSLLYIQQISSPKVYRLRPTYLCEKEIFYLLREFLMYHLDIDISKKLQSKSYKSFVPN